MTRKTTELTQAQKIADLEKRLAKATAETAEAEAKNTGRATQAISWIKANPVFTTKTLAEALNIESKNASSVLNALKKRQYRWVKNGDDFIYCGKMNDASWTKRVEDLATRESVAKEA